MTCGRWISRASIASRRASRCFPLSVLDDHSRFAVGLFALTGTAGAPVQAALRRCFERYGLPVAMLVDHGTPWWSTSNGHGLTTLAVDLIRQGIDLIYSGVRHPQTQGKVERFHRTLARRLRQWGVPDAAWRRSRLRSIAFARNTTTSVRMKPPN